MLTYAIMSYIDWLELYGCAILIGTAWLLVDIIAPDRKNASWPPE